MEEAETITEESFLNGKVKLLCGDSRDMLKQIPDSSIDSIVTDPPYALVSIQKRFGKPGSAPVKVDDVNASNDLKAAYARASAGFMGKQWDTGETAFDPDFWAECLRVLKPGGHLVAFSGTRTYHRMTCAIEDAGFEVRDMLQWLYGSGFPKSHDVSKGIDRRNGDNRPVIGRAKGAASSDTESLGEFQPEYDLTSAASAAWEGWGTALKPACEPICFGRKPLIGTVAANVLKHGTGAINIDASRINWVGPKDTAAAAAAAAVGFAESRAKGTATQSNSIGKESRDGTNNYDPDKLSGRWPANVVHDGSEEVLEAFPESDSGSGSGSGGIWSPSTGKPAGPTYGDGKGSAARFFYTAKADSDDRIGSKHPTVKPVDLMRWLVCLVTPKGGTVLDPFAGTGSTAEAAFYEGMSCVLVERESEYQADIRRRMRLVMAGPDERSRESIKARLGDKALDAGPLFAGQDAPPAPADRFTESSRTKNRADRNEAIEP